MSEFDVSEIREFEIALGKSADDVLKAMKPIVARGAFNIKRDMQADAAGHPKSRHFPRAITYDTTETKSEVRAEIGPDKDKPQGALGNILYFGTSKNSPVLDINGPLDREEPKFIKAVEEAIEGLL